MVANEFVQERISENLPGAVVKVDNPRGDDVHFKVEVEYKGFEGKTKIEQHRMVYEALNEKLSDCGMPLHALQIKTKVKNG